MGRMVALLGGTALLVFSSALFVVDVVSLDSLLLTVLAVLAYGLSLLTGKKLAAYKHDLHLAKSRNYKVGPATFIYISLLLFILFVLIYTVAKIGLGYFVKVLLLPMGGSYMGIVYNLLALFGSYLLFVGAYSRRENFITMWGKAAGKGSEAMKPVENMAKKPAKVAKNVAGKMEGEMRKFMP